LHGNRLLEATAEDDVALRERFESESTAVVDRWAELALSVYPTESAVAMRREKDRFQNPVGNITRESLDELYRGLLAGRPARELADSLDDMLRIRAVQDLSPSTAVAFVFLLKRAAREAQGNEAPDLDELDASIERLALAAFDVYTSCREKIYELRIREIKRRASVLLERAEDEPAACGTCHQDKGGCGA
jgi:hypothetical protein